MPDARGHFRGQGWSRKREAALDRIFRPPSYHDRRLARLLRDRELRAEYERMLHDIKEVTK